MWIKICGNTSLVDAQLAAGLCADAIGFIFAASPRQVIFERVAAIVPQLPPDLTQIGVFQTRDFATIASTLRATGLHGAQLHGGLDLALIDQLRSAFGEPAFLVQSLHWPLDQDPAQTERNLRDAIRTLRSHGGVDAILLDAKTATISGGTGKSFDWKRAQQILAAEAGKLRTILAGGLTPENVTEAIRTLRPWGVDVASGVESSPGKKDPARVHDFITAARAAFAAIENANLPNGARLPV
jgi:phosphoribosylanthranilate isomerase